MKKLLEIFANKQKAIFSIAAMVVTTILILWMFPQQKQSTHYDYAEGGYWRSNDLYAPFDFTVLRSQNEIDREVAQAKAESMLYYTMDSNAYDRAQKNLARLAESIPAARKHSFRKTIDSVYTIGFIQRPEGMPDFESRTLVLLQGNVGSEHVAGEFVSASSIDDTLLRDSILVPSLLLDATRTRLELDSRLSQLRYASGMVQHGELIVAKGQFVDPETAQKIRSLELENDSRFAVDYSPVGHYAGRFMLCVIAFIALYLFLTNVRHQILNNIKGISFVITIILLMMAATALVVRINPDWVMVVPLCVAPILVRIFYDMRVALYIHLTTVIILANMVPNAFEFIFYQLITGMMSIIVVKDFEHRSKFFLVSAVLFVTYALIYTAGVLSQESNLGVVTMQRYLIFFINALLTLMAYPLIYIFERIFGMTTNLTLMELSSTNNPALRELSRQAPGTFQHSMQVANISEDIVSEIGGDPLKAKVGGLYHDIGKLNNPLLYTENQTDGYNPHDELSPEESADMIISHVSDGIDLAKKFHLPLVVKDFIRTHHGTTRTGYFYAKYLETHPDGVTDAKMFIYPGPKPFTKETAVVMIVDSVEAACKSLKHHDHESISRMVDNVVDGKIRDNQFQNCDLTFAELDQVREHLKSKMMSIYHARIEYPTVQAENR